MRAKILVRGGRDPIDGQVEEGPYSRGQDVAVTIVRDGKLINIPNIKSIVLRVEGRRAIATLEVLVDDVQLTGVMLK